jgi:DNA polymerase
MSSVEKPAHDNTDTLLASLKKFFLEERDLFGDTLLMLPPRQSHEAPLISSKESPEPLLFGEPAPAHPAEPWASATSLADLNKQICECLKCPLGNTRTKFVFGVGNPNATLLLVGEAPGADEDLQGEPFVGRAGQLLNKILEAIRFKREDVYICNILKCRPPGNRNPEQAEVDQCIPYLRKQIDLVRPKVILCLGLVAAGHLLGSKESLGRLRGRVLHFGDIPVMVTYHPAALLRNPNWKRPAWEDVQAVRKLHDELVQQ